MSKYVSKTTSDCEKCLKKTKQVMARVTEKKGCTEAACSKCYKGCHVEEEACLMLTQKLKQEPIRVEETQIGCIKRLY